MTIKDNTILHLSEPFRKTWRLRNAGTCPWTTGYKIVFIGGDQLGASGASVMPINVSPGQTVDVSVDMTAPNAAGHYEGVWELQSPDGRTFGVGPLNKDKIWVRIRVIAPAFSTTTPSLVPPTTTPTVTSTVGPAATESQAPSPEAAATPGAEIRYDFAANACAAQWQNFNDLLPCPGQDGDPRGFILRLNSAQLEDGTVTSLPSILTFPSNASDGYIMGIYPEYDVQPGDHFQASVGCEQGATACSVLFRVYYLDQTKTAYNIWTLGEFYDGKYFNLDLDLYRLAGQRVKFALSVGSLGSASGDRALWVAPRIVHLAVATASATEAPTQTVPASTITAVLSPVPSATPAAMPTSEPTATPPAVSQPSSLQQFIDSIVSFFHRLFGGK